MSFSILSQISPPTTMPYRIAETLSTCDGPRTRLTQRAFATLAEAEEALARLAPAPSGDASRQEASPRPQLSLPRL